jgi:hypothetical protein
MATFGSFESDRENYSGPAYTVYTARKPGDAQTDYAIKVFYIRRIAIEAEPAADLDQLLSDIERSCVERIALQQQASSRSQFISPVFETGQDQRGVWYVTRFYPRSVNKIITGRVALSRDALHHIIHAVAQGALDIKRACGRSHGDIQPSNIQISRSERLVEAEVVLSDLLPGGQSEAARYELSDLHAIGRILLQLVLRREISTEEMLILPMLISSEWKRLFGKDAEEWLRLCNRLLDPNLSIDDYSLETLVEKLDLIKSKPPVSRKVVLSAAAVLLVLGMAMVFVLRYLNYGYVLVTSDPPGAKITEAINGRSLGKTPPVNAPFLKIKLPKGNSILVAEHPDLLERRTNTVAIVGGKSRPHQFQFAYGRVRITSVPTNAEVMLLDGRPVGRTPYPSPPLPPGSRTFVLRLEGHRQTNVEITVPSDGKLTSIEAPLVRLESDEVQIEIESEPPFATIKEGTNIIGTARFASSFTLRRGSHTLTAHYQDWPPVTNKIVLVSGYNQPTNFYIPHGVLRFDVTPPGAALLVHTNRVTNEPPREYLRPGHEYAVRITHDGYKPFETRIKVKERETTNLVKSLEPILGLIGFTTVPSGAAIFDAKEPQKELGRTPVTLPFPPKQYTFLARYPGLDDLRSAPVTVKMGDTTSLRLPFIHGTLEFDTEPIGATISIDGKVVGKSPSTNYLRPGMISYSVELPYYHSEQASLELKDGAKIRLPPSRSLRPKDVTLVLQSDPAGAEFRLGDMTLRGTNDSYLVPWGTHPITATYPTYPGLDPKTESVEVKRDGTSTKKFEFSYATLVITNKEPDASLLYQDRFVTNFPARVPLKPDTAYVFSVKYGADIVTNLQVQLARREIRAYHVFLPELATTYSNSIGMELVRVKELYVGKFETTWEQYHAVMGGDWNTSYSGMPKQRVGWSNALEFCRKLSLEDGASMSNAKIAGWKYDLPTEDEWRSFAGNDTNQFTEAVLSGRTLRSAPEKINPLRQSKNGAGLYDLFGNVAEWCYGATNQPVALGASYTASIRTLERQIRFVPRAGDPERVVIDGAFTIGFRCVLKPPP